MLLSLRAKYFFIVLFFSVLGFSYAQVDDSKKKVTINFGAIKNNKKTKEKEEPPKDYKVNNKDFDIEITRLKFKVKPNLLSPKAKNGLNYQSNLDLEFFGKERPKGINFEKKREIPRYLSDNEKILKYIKEGGYVGHFPDIDLGTATTTSDIAYIQFADTGSELDGDIISIIVNGKTLVEEIVLTRFVETFELDLVEGFNQIEILAVNEGKAKPNSMFLLIQDGDSVVFTTRHYLLSTGSAGKLLLIKK